jgi:biopolymer transport protein ExbB
MFLAAIDIIEGAGLLAYPLLLCSLVMLFIICERAYALRRSAIMPQDLVDAIVAGRPVMGGRHTVLGRIIAFAEQHPGDADAVKAFARLEVNRMASGLPYLDVIYAAAPLLGLTATVWSLLQVFSSISGETGQVDGAKFTAGVALALSGTFMGLCIAIVALFGGGILQRRVENYAARLDVLLERILARSARGVAEGPPAPVELNDVAR